MALVFAVAMLYSSVGHGGASGYLAVMGLVGMTAAQTKPSALVLNLLVAGIGSIRYIRSGCFSWRAFWPFAVGSIPFAFLGGSQQFSEPIYKRMLGGVLVVAAVSMLTRCQNDENTKPPPPWLAAPIGIAIGYLSGIVGVGGGIFLSPVLILSRWAKTKATLGIAALFIFVNSAAGLLGNLYDLQSPPVNAIYLAPAAFVGGLVGSWLGAQKLNTTILRILLAGVLLTASFKMFVEYH